MYPQQASRQLQTLPMEHVESLISVTICIFCYLYFLDQLCRPHASYIHHNKNSLWVLYPQRAPDNSKHSLWAILNYWYLLLSVYFVICIFWTNLQPRIIITYTTAKNLFEFCIFIRRPDNSRHCLWGILKHWYSLLSVLFVIGMFWNNFVAQDALYIHHSKKSFWFFVCSAGAPTAPNIPHGAFWMIDIY